MAPVPAEIGDRIVDFLHDDREALSACGLVHSSWIPSVRYHRFQDVKLAWRSTKKFHALLLTSPTIALYVTTLWMTSNGLVNPEELETCCHVLSQMTNIRKLTFGHFILDSVQSRAISDAIPQSVEELQLFQMDLRCMGDLIRLWIALPRLRSFEIVDVLWIRSEEMPEEFQPSHSRRVSHDGDGLPMDVSPVTFSELHLRWWVRLFDVVGDWLCAQHITAQLRACSLYVFGPPDAPIAARILRALGPSLETLELQAMTADLDGGDDFTPLYTCDLAQCTQLSELRLYASLELVKGHRQVENYVLRWAPGFLRQIRTSSIKTVLLAIEGSNGEWPALADLSDLAAALSGKAFNQLQEVIVQLWDPHSGEVGEETMAYIRQELKPLRAGLLEIRVKTLV